MNRSRRFRLPSPRPRAFTLLEIMLVVMIIALLGGAAIYYMGGNIGIAQDTRVSTDIQTISTQLKIYQNENGFLPTTQQGLEALVAPATTDPKPRKWRRPYLEKVPQDPWHNDYFYVFPGKKNPNSFDLFSAGPDRSPETEDDLGNWEE